MENKRQSSNDVKGQSSNPLTLQSSEKRRLADWQIREKRGLKLRATSGK